MSTTGKHAHVGFGLGRRADHQEGHPWCWHARLATWVVVLVAVWLAMFRPMEWDFGLTYTGAAFGPWSWDFDLFQSEPVVTDPNRPLRTPRPIPGTYITPDGTQLCSRDYVNVNDDVPVISCIPWPQD